MSIVPIHKIPVKPTKEVQSKAFEAFNDAKIILPTMEGLLIERVAEIRYLEAAGNYTCIYFKDNRKLLICRTLLELEKAFQSFPHFVRIHRSYTINICHLSKYIKGKGGYAVLESGKTLKVSAGRKQFFLDSLYTSFVGCQPMA